MELQIPFFSGNSKGMGLEVPFVDAVTPQEGAFPGQEGCGAEGSWEITNAAFLTFPNTFFLCSFCFLLRWAHQALL